ncbi:hypothetical protein BDY21DRAFT_395004 [Lineolata rhizophorae]|uniref:Uncharacterized protein n=1 Tax=Lineolata rhizophorae TaxID=578093 RepID=A0A6A6NVL9_9PEZI|nr:hypothetical protein BDY21DRAFT_395004 [Lineolata rhizophorae]
MGVWRNRDKGIRRFARAVSASSALVFTTGAEDKAPGYIASAPRRFRTFNYTEQSGDVNLSATKAPPELSLHLFHNNPTTGIAAMPPIKIYSNAPIKPSDSDGSSSVDHHPSSSTTAATKPAGVTPQTAAPPPTRTTAAPPPPPATTTTTVHPSPAQPPPPQPGAVPVPPPTAPTATAATAGPPPPPQPGARPPPPSAGPGAAPAPAPTATASSGAAAPPAPAPTGMPPQFGVPPPGANAAAGRSTYVADDARAHPPGYVQGPGMGQGRPGWVREDAQGGSGGGWGEGVKGWLQDVGEGLRKGEEGVWKWVEGKGGR